MTDYLDPSRTMPYCRGCGHPHVLRALDAALKAAAVPLQSLSLVTDIGCVGLADSLFPAVHTVHTLHGRSVAIAAGIRLASRAVKPVVLIGDGGAGIGLLHLVHAAQMNAGVTVVVHNNLIYGMTGGQHSVLTPVGLRTTTTPDGSPFPPLDLGAILSGAGAGFFARTVAPGDEVVAILEEALRYPGFSCVEVFDLCPTFASAKGGVTGKELRAIPERAGLALGVLRRGGAGEFGTPPVEAGERVGQPVTSDARSRLGGREGAEPTAGSAPKPTDEGVVPTRAWGRLDRRAQVVIAGRAGERVQSAALLAASAACAAGLQATVRTDNPVTQGTGFSLAELTIAPEPVAYVGLERPDVVIVTAPEGHAELEARGVLSPSFGARRVVLDAESLRSKFGPSGAALGALAEEIDAAGWWDRAAWEAAISRFDPKRRAETAALFQKAWAEGR